MRTPHARRTVAWLALAAALACLGSCCTRDEPAVGALVGRPAMEFTHEVEQWVNGTEPDPEALKGRPVLLYFWHPRDGRSLPTLPLVQGLAAAFADQGLVTVGVCVLDEPAEVEPLLREHKVTFRIALDCDADLHEHYRIDKTGTPYCYLIDGQQTIVWEGPPDKLSARRIARLLPPGLR